MKPTSKETLPCAIFGHNFKRSKTNIDYTTELTCIHCNIIEVTDNSGNFRTNTVSNTQIMDTFQELYRLTLRFKKLKASW